MNNLKKYRKKNKVPASKLAELIGVGIQAYYKYERGVVEPSIQTLILLADFYHTTIDDLAGRNFKQEFNFYMLSDTQKDLAKKISDCTDTTCEKLLAFLEGMKQAK